MWSEGNEALEDGITQARSKRLPIHKVGKSRIFVFAWYNLESSMVRAPEGTLPLSLPES